MTNHADIPDKDVGPDVPFWHHESDLRQRIKGRYIRRASIALAALNLLLVLNLAL